MAAGVLDLDGSGLEGDRCGSAGRGRWEEQECICSRAVLPAQTSKSQGCEFKSLLLRMLTG